MWWLGEALTSGSCQEESEEALCLTGRAGAREKVFGRGSP